MIQYHLFVLTVNCSNHSFPIIKHHPIINLLITLFQLHYLNFHSQYFLCSLILILFLSHSNFHLYYPKSPFFQPIPIFSFLFSPFSIFPFLILLFSFFLFFLDLWFVFFLFLFIFFLYLSIQFSIFLLIQLIFTAVSSIHILPHNFAWIQFLSIVAIFWSWLWRFPDSGWRIAAILRFTAVFLLMRTVYKLIFWIQANLLEIMTTNQN